MPQDVFIGARVNPAVAESFALACELDGTTVSAALRRLMAAYIATVADASKNGTGPLAESRSHCPTDRCNTTEPTTRRERAPAG